MTLAVTAAHFSPGGNDGSSNRQECEHRGRALAASCLVGERRVPGRNRVNRQELGERRVAPFLEVAARTDLPMRGAVGSEGNYQRSVTMAKAFRQAKTGRK